MNEELSDPRRTEPPYVVATERDMLEAWLEFHRTTLLLKCEGLEDQGRKAQPVPTSVLSLHGLVRHLAEVERNWFRRVLLREPDAPRIWPSSTDEGSFGSLGDADWEADLAAWVTECNCSRTTAADRGLEDTGLRHGEPCSLRWIYVHMIEEYARHNGHADLIRELVDGSVGW
jgi:hypothetical protein